MVTAYTYNDANLISTMGTSVGNNTVTDFSYSYYTNGNVRGESSQEAAYTYDYGGRLIEELYGTVNLGTWCDKTYTYDASGNRTQTVCDDSGTTTTVTNTYNIMNQLVSQTDSVSGTKTFTYDTRGNLTNDGTYRYYYDDWNRLQSSFPVNTYSGTGYQYYMNGLRRSKHKSGQGYTYYIWLDGDMVYEFTSNTSHTYTYGHRLLYSDTYNYVLNAHGDVVALLNSSGTVVKRYEYDAFGTEFAPSSTDTNPFRYCAEYFDTESGQIYLRARYYQPRNGRFSQLDPARDGTNWYVYCYNNPLLFIDPLGTDAILIQFGFDMFGLGHTGLLIESENEEWIYFYWAAGDIPSLESFERVSTVISDVKNAISVIKGNDSKPVSRNKMVVNLGTLEFDHDKKNYLGTINKKLYEEKIKTVPATSIQYFEGDFSKSIESVNEIITNKEQYNLYYNNCLQVSLRILNEGTLLEKNEDFHTAIDSAINGLPLPNCGFFTLKKALSEEKSTTKFNNRNKGGHKWKE